MKRSITTFAFLAALTLLGACSGSQPPVGGGGGGSSSSTSDAPSEDPVSDDGEDGAEPTQDPETSESPEPEPPAQADSVLGTVDVAGVTYEITEVRRCDPLVMDMLERELEVQGMGDHEGERVQIDVYVQEVGGTRLDEVSWTGPEGVFGGPEDARVTFDGSRVSGSATLVDGLTQEQTLPVSFDLEVPAEILSCR